MLETKGVCNNYTKTIYLANNLTKYQLKKVLCHELVHAAMFSYDIQISNLEEEELIANVIASYGKEIIKMTDKILRRLYFI